MWFRKAQVALKVLLLLCSITVGLSIDGWKKLVRIQDQTVLVRRDRRISHLGIGGAENFFSELLFVRNAHGCVFQERDSSSGSVAKTFRNARSLKPVDHNEFGESPAVECLSERKGFNEQEILQGETRILDWRCNISYPTLSEIGAASTTGLISPDAHGVYLTFTARFSIGEAVRILWNRTMSNYCSSWS